LSNNQLNILMLGDVIGSPGIKEIFLKLSQLKKKWNIDIAIVNGENSNDGFGITEENISELKKSGIDVITSGNHIWAGDNADRLLENYDCLLRPANYPKASGKGWWKGTIKGANIGIVNLLGRYYMVPIDCPFTVLDKLLKNELKDCSIIIIDFHAESIFEKKALAFDFDGRISLMAGTHTHVQTADEMILQNGTGYITDLGLCGGIDSVIGMIKDDVIKKLINQNIIPFKPSYENPQIQGIVANIDIESKKTTFIQRFSI
jgi:metallophosphoesterase (TIGR00282 family)